MNHTQSPWGFKTEQESNGYKNESFLGTVYGGKGEWEIAGVWKDCNDNDLDDENAESIANAKLIAAAPDLLENLIRLVDRMEENAMGHMSAVTRAKAAIQKATT